MKNRFRFRVWNGKEMLYNSGLGYGEGNQLIEDKGHTIMQCTGLKVNGKLLFEGDIVFVKDRNEYFVVVWKENFAEFWLVNIYKIDEAANILFGSDNREIVGNIYENKDILEKQNEK